MSTDGWTVPRPPILRGAPRSFRGRVVLSTILLMVAVMVVVGIGVQLLLAVTVGRDVDRVLEDRADAMVAVVDASAGVVPESRLDPGVLVYDDHGEPVSGSVQRAARATADDLATTDRARTVEAADDLRLRAVPFTTSTGQRGVLVVTEETTAYERAAAYALLATVVIGVLVVTATGVIANRVTTVVLAPVARMAERATEWSEHDLSRRFDLDASDHELAQLGATLDGLLDRVAMAIRAEQRLTSELAHELRTPLTAVRGAADLALMRGVADDETRAELQQIAASADAMSEVITTLVDVARERVATATSHVADVVEVVRSMVPTGLAFVDRTASSSGRMAAPGELVLRALAPVVDNAVAHARTTVTLAAADTARAVEISVHDDGPGLGDLAAESVFAIGSSGRGGTGLGLGIAQRVARSMGGGVRVEESEDGATFVVTVPRA